MLNNKVLAYHPVMTSNTTFQHRQRHYYIDNDLIYHSSTYIVNCIFALAILEHAVLLLELYLHIDNNYSSQRSPAVQFYCEIYLCYLCYVFIILIFGYMKLFDCRT